MNRTPAAAPPAEQAEAATLEEAGALRADVLVACTGLDEDNLVISLLARRHLDIPRVVALVNDDANHWVFGEPWGVDAAVSAAAALVALIEKTPGPGGAGRQDGAGSAEPDPVGGAGWRRG